MTDTPRTDRAIASLDRLAAATLALVRDLHAQLMAASDARTVTKLARAYERAGRDLRATLALKARLVRAAAARRAQAEAAALRAFREAQPAPTLH